MANVFTRLDGLPRTTTLKDFRDPNQTLSLLSYKPSSTNKNERIPLLKVDKTNSRPRSPTRKQNPQPLGLKYQQPYNRFTQTFGIWNPNAQVINRNYDNGIIHAKRVNFSCDHDTPLYQIRKRPEERTSSLKQQCAKITSVTFKDPRTDGVKKQTEQQVSFQWPAQQYVYKKAESPFSVATGIVPDVFGWGVIKK